MEGLLDIAKGPLFCLTFLLMLFGLARIVILDIREAVVAYRKAGDKSIDWSGAIGKTLEWLFPVKSILSSRPIYSLCSILFHVGLIIVPIFLLAHVRLFESALGFGWYTIPKFWADMLTLATIVFGAALFIGRVVSSDARFLSRRQDFIWPLLLIVPFITGFICANMSLSPSLYQFIMLTHMLAAELIFVLIPFTKIAHCVIMPFSQFIISLAWKFPAHVDDDICETLDKKGAPV